MNIKTGKVTYMDESEDFIIMTDGTYSVAAPLNDDWLSFEPII